MSRGVKFIGLYLLGIAGAAGAFYSGGSLGYLILGLLAALLFEAAKPAELLNADGAQKASLSDKSSGRAEREMLWHAALGFLKHDKSESMSDTESRRFDFEREMYLMGLAQLHNEDLIDVDFVSEAIDFTVGLRSVHFDMNRLENLFILSLYKERASGFLEKARLAEI